MVGNPTNSLYFDIHMLGSTRVFHMRVQNKDDYEAWTTVIKDVIERSKGKQNKFRRIVALSFFWRMDRISEEDFREKVMTGDLLLFRSKNFTSKIQRSFCGSDYDHVGILLRFADDQIVVLESTAGDGVDICLWEMFTEKKWHLLFEKLVYRPLICERPSNTIATMERFIKEALGKKYSISPKKLLKRTSTVINDQPKDYIDENRTFFCSELVAALYKSLGYLPAAKSSATYWPGTFSAAKNLQLEKGAKLGEEFLIDFEL
eukprot:TRINITY_DN4054_c0_g2_i16.p1 TRINITY_DN4054_c0_g2~~TRINITY_DN4054_c0_g2_i16.p1  ORF type:complete len:261 (+),score=4.39 TRINITY_DN4054_c0_g2_i16:142-924(+)